MSDLTDTEKRDRTNLGAWQIWVMLFVAIVLLGAAIVLASAPGRQAGAVASGWLSVLVLIKAFSFQERRSHEELVKDVAALRDELEKLKKTR